MSKTQPLDDAAKKEIRDEIDRRWEDWLVGDVYAGDEQLTLELRKKLGYPLTAEEALERMRAAQREQASSKRKSA
jgi:hypothetical protein